MMRIIVHVSALRPMEDSVNWQAIPAGTPLVAGYVPPSHFAWPAAAWAKFANSIEVRITPSASVFGTENGAPVHVLDIESGDATPAQAPGWVNASRGAGQEGTCYCSISTWPAVIRAINAAGITTHPPYWVAGYPGGGPVLPSIRVDGRTYTATAHQYADPATSGGDYDLSVVAPYWPGVDSNPIGGFLMALSDQQQNDVYGAIMLIRDQITGGIAPDGSLAGWSGLPVKDPNSQGMTLVDMANYLSHQFADPQPSRVPGSTVTIASLRDAILDTNAAAFEANAAISAEEADLLAAIKTVGSVNVDPAALAAALETAGFPAALVAALLTVLNKAATGGSKS